MDFSKLTPQEVSITLQEIYPGYNFNNPYEKVADTFKVINTGKSYPKPIVDLYIAHSLHNNGLEVPLNYNVYDLPEREFVELTKLYYLPPIDSIENRERAERITRILNDIKISFNPSVLKVELIPVAFYGKNNYGDFSWMINRPEYNNALFIFDETQEDFLKFAEYSQSGILDTNLCNRLFKDFQQLQCQDPPKAAGIPVASDDKGYQDIITALPYVEGALNYIESLIKSGHYTQILYPAERDDRTFRTSYNVSPDIKEYIVNSLENFSSQ
jgi:hypothetical protein